MTPRGRFLAVRLAYVAIILFATMTQLDFSPDLTAAGQRLARAFTPSLGWRDARDGLRNTVFFAGLGVAWVMSSLSGKVRAEIERATLVGFGLSVTVEGLQVFSPIRTASIVDVATNTLGAFAGALFVALFLVALHRARGARSYLGVPTLLLAGAYSSAVLCEALTPLFRSAPPALVEWRAAGSVARRPWARPAVAIGGGAVVRPAPLRARRVSRCHAAGRARALGAADVADGCGRRRGVRVRGRGRARDVGAVDPLGGGRDSRGGRGRRRLVGDAPAGVAVANPAWPDAGTRGHRGLRSAARSVGVAPVPPGDGDRRDRPAAHGGPSRAARVVGAARGRLQRAARRAALPPLFAPRLPARRLAVAAGGGALVASLSGCLGGRGDR